METIHQGIVINKIDYDEYDEIVTILTMNKPITFLAKGTRKIQSKNRSRLQLLNVVECEIFQARLEGKMSKLKRADLIAQFDINTNINVTNKLLLMAQNIDSNPYEFVSDFFFLVNKFGKGDDNLYLLILIFDFLTCTGLKVKTDGCVICKTKNNIVDFIPHEGGFLCNRHAKNSKHPDYLQTVYLTTGNIEIYIDNANRYAVLKIIEDLWIYIKENTFL
ncbi:MULTISPECIES: DNA repair protein RecO [unclassified Mycoplasma]